MAFTIEKVLADARLLVTRLRDHDSLADSLISQTQVLNKRVDAMKLYQEDLNELNEIARHRPRSTLILGLAQENSQIRELQQENKELHASLEEHQGALELIMSKYREQVFKLIVANRLNQKSSFNPEQAVEVEEKIDKICEMASVMQNAIRIDDDAVVKDQQFLTQLQVENRTLRELLRISVGHQNYRPEPDTVDIDSQTDDNIGAGPKSDKEEAKTTDTEKKTDKIEEVDNIIKDSNESTDDERSKSDQENGNN